MSNEEGLELYEKSQKYVEMLREGIIKAVVGTLGVLEEANEPPAVVVATLSQAMLKVLAFHIATLVANCKGKTTIEECVEEHIGPLPGLVRIYLASFNDDGIYKGGK